MLDMLERKAIIVVFANVEDILLTNTVRLHILPLKNHLLNNAADLPELIGRASERLQTVRRQDWRYPSNVHLEHGHLSGTTPSEILFGKVTG